MQAKSPVKTLDELHVCEMPSWLSYPSERQRSQCVDKSFQVVNEERVCPTSLEVESADECPKTPRNPILNLNTAVVEQTTEKMSKAKERGPHCYVITARARSFLYHQVHALTHLMLDFTILNEFAAYLYYLHTFVVHTLSNLSILCINPLPPRFPIFKISH